MWLYRRILKIPWKGRVINKKMATGRILIVRIRNRQLELPRRNMRKKSLKIQASGGIVRTREIRESSEPLTR